MERYRDQSIDRKAVKALVAVFGPREAARQAGLSPGTVLAWCHRFKWKKADRIIRKTGINGDTPIANKDAAQVLTEALQRLKDESTHDLARFTAKAAKQAASHADPLKVAGSVRHVASVYSTLYPPEEGGEMIEGAILIGRMQVKDSPQEMLAVTENVREELPNQ